MATQHPSRATSATDTDQRPDKKRVGRVLFGALVGLAVGMVAGVNLVIFAGVGDGYETRIGTIFDENAPIGVLVVAIWLISPIVGGYVAWRRRE